MNRKVLTVFSLIAALGLGGGCRSSQSSSAATAGKAAKVPAEKETPGWVTSKDSYKPSRTRHMDLLHTRLKVSFDWEKQHLLGEALLRLKPYFYPQNQVVLDAKGFDIHYIGLLGKNEERKLNYTYDNRQITIDLGKTFSRTDTLSLIIEYTAKPNELPQGGSDAITSDKGLYFINPLGEEPGKPKQIWTQGETEASSAWFPTIDAPNERMTQEIYITVDQKYTTLSNGTFIYSRKNADGTKTELWRQEQPHAPYLAMMAIGEFAVVKDKWRDLEVDYYVEPAYKSTAKAIFGNTPEMLEFFSTKLGVPYPWSKYAQVVVRDYVSGAMENTTASLFMEALQLNQRELLDQNWDNIIAHELFHHWFGNYVTTESWANLPLNEAFADYSEFLWAEHKYGKDEAALTQQKALEQYLAESETKQEPLIRFHYKDKEDMFDSHSYAKGGRVLHMLRQYVGDDAFWTSLHKYLTDNKFSSVEIHNLRLAFEAVTGEDLNWFFNQWFLSPGHPELRVQHTYADGKVQLQVTQLQDSAYTPVYKLPLTVSVWNNNLRSEHKIVVEKATQVFELPVPSQPDLVLFDGQQQLLGTIEHAKTDAELLYQFRHSQQYLPKYEALMQLGGKAGTPEVNKMLQEALQDKFWAIRSLALSVLEAFPAVAENMQEAVKQMALHDKKSQVRADAIQVLAEIPDADFSAIFRQALKDSSYLVNAVALNAYAKTKPADLQQQLSAYEKETNPNLVLVLAGIYADSKVPNKNEWFLRHLNTLQSNNLFFFIESYAPYMAALPKSEQQPARQKLEQLARNHPSFYIRLSAYKTLVIAATTDQEKAILQDIRNNEKDERLLQFYKMMQ